MKGRDTNVITLTSLLGKIGLHRAKYTSVGRGLGNKTSLSFDGALIKQLSSLTSGTMGSWSKLVNPSNRFLFKRTLSARVSGNG